MKGVDERGREPLSLVRGGGGEKEMAREGEGGDGKKVKGLQKFT